MPERIQILAVLPSRAIEGCEITLVWEGDHFATAWGRAGRNINRRDLVGCLPSTAREHYRDASVRGRIVAPFPYLTSARGLSLGSVR